MTLNQKAVREALALNPLGLSTPEREAYDSALRDLEEIMQVLRTEHGTQEIVACEMCRRLRAYFGEA